MGVRIADIPFRERPPLELLGLGGGAPPGDEFAEFGWTRLEALALSDATGRVQRVGPALVLALHSPDDWPNDGVAMLEFQYEREREPLSVIVPLVRFLDVHAPSLVGGERDIVLALCNPHAIVVDVLHGTSAADRARPEWLGERRIHYGLGDVTAWLDPGPREALPIRLDARRWRVTPETSPRHRSGGHT